MHYYGDQDNPYKNDRLNHYLKTHLPMDEFGRGNFSQGYEIIKVYRTYIAQCLEEATKEYIGKDADITTHLQKELEKLEQQKRELTRHKQEMVQNIKKREGMVNALRDEQKEDKTWQAIRKKFEYLEFDKERLSNFFYKLEQENNEQYIQVKDIYQKFMASPHYQVIGRDIIGWEELQQEKGHQKDNKIWQALYKELEKLDFEKRGFERLLSQLEYENPENYKIGEATYKELISAPYYQNLERKERESYEMVRRVSERNDLTRQLSHKSNSLNIEQQIKNIKTKQEARGIEKDIKQKIDKILRKRDHFGNIADARDKQSMFTSVIATNLITDSQTDKKFKNNLIRTHTDKRGLFQHIWNIYTGYSQAIHNLIQHKIPELDQKDLKEQSIETLVQEAKRVLEKFDSMSHFRIKDTTPEEFKLRQEMGSAERRSHQIETLTNHMATVLREKKNCNRPAVEDPKLRKLFEAIHITTESHDFENICGKIRDVDFRRERDILMIDGKKILQEIYRYMSSEERKQTDEQYTTWKLFDNIKKEVLIKEDIQLKLFDLPVPEVKEEPIITKKTRKKKV